MEQSSIKSYCEEWRFLFENSNVGNITDLLKQICLQGKLQGSHFRSVCWKILLGCLSNDKSKWLDQTNVSRQAFTNLKLKYDVDPRKLDDTKIDLTLNNPLSQQNNSPWQQYFIDVELKTCIRQDVERTFPELAYFQSEQVREMMIDILFIYGRENPHISYKQGMHEILGPLIFVLYSDQQSLSHALEQQEFSQMFSYIMQIIQPWYYFGSENKESEKISQQQILEPFCRPQDCGPTSALIRKLNFIGDVLLQNADTVLFNHLEQLEIPPQIYGIRWLRLLFGREFPIQDLLFLWDTIFAGGQPFLLVDYIFVAMLVFIREDLLSCDYTGCLHYLMRYPPVADVHQLIALALHQQDPKKYSRPHLTSRTNFSHITVAGRPHPNIASRTAEDVPNWVGKPIVVPSNVVRIVKQKNYANDDNFVQVRTSSTLPRHRNNDLVFNKNKHNRQQHPTGSFVTEDELDLLKEQVSCLQTRVNDVENENRNCSRQFRTLIDELESKLNLNTTPDDQQQNNKDEIKQILTEMRRVCVKLKGDERQQQKQYNVNKNIVINVPQQPQRKNSLLNPEQPTNSPIEIGNDPTLSMSPVIPPANKQHNLTAAATTTSVSVKSKNEFFPPQPRQKLGAENEMQIIKICTSGPSTDFK